MCSRACSHGTAHRMKVYLVFQLLLVLHVLAINVRDDRSLGEKTADGLQLDGNNDLPLVRGTQVCFTTHPDYNARQCEQGALGMTLENLRDELFRHAARASMSLQELQLKCKKRVKVFTILEMEAKFPQLATCWLSTYAGQLQFGAQNVACRAETLEEADVVYMPAYLAQECNWPHYGGADCNHQANTFRKGQICREEALEAASLLQKEHGKPVIINDMHPFDSIHGHEAKQIWAKLNLLTTMYTKRHTISQPPPPVWPRCLVCSANKTAQCYGTALNQKRYKLTFKGNMRSNVIRQAVADQSHNPGERVVIVESGDGQYDYDELLFNTMFSLILPGDAAFSYRFTEAVCSGGVPVLVTDDWLPPFEQSVPFESYGIKVSEATARGGGLMAELGKHKMRDLEERRQLARRLCERSLSKVELQARHMISEALRIL